MQRLLTLALAALLTLGISLAAFAAVTDGKLTVKAGETIYVCACDEGCPCGTVAKKAGECGCKQPLAKTTVTKVENGKVFYQLNGKERSASLTGAYTCACGKTCDCDTISQKPGKCGCGGKLTKVKKP